MHKVDNNKDLLYSTRNYIHVISYNGNKSEK